MSFFNRFPFTNFHEINLDWILSEMRRLSEDFNNYQSLNKITYGGIWDIAKNYPKWTIVTHGNNSYISLQPITPNTDIANAEKWLLAANLDPRFDELLVKFAQQTEAVNTALKEQTEAVNTALKEQTEAVNTAVGRTVFGTNHVVWFGDSYANGATSESGKGWQVYLQNYFPGSKFEGLANGGGGFTREGYYPYTFANLVEYAYANGHITDPETVDTVVIMGGINDADSYASEYEGVANFISACKNRFPNAKILCAFNSTPKNFALNSCQGMAAACTDYGAYFIEISPYFNLTADDRFVSTDEIHVNDSGYKNIARMFYEAMNGYEPFFVSTSVQILNNGVAFRPTFTRNGVLMQLWGTVAETGNNGIVVEGVLPLSLKPFGLAKPVVTAMNGTNSLVYAYISNRSVAAPFGATAGSYYEYIGPAVTPYQCFQL